MSKKYILNDREVIFNEDVEQNDDWGRRDLFRFLEGLFLRAAHSAPTAAGTVGGAVIGGLDIDTSTTALAVDISPGTALMAFGALDHSVTNGYQICALESTATVTLPPASAGSYRWDLIEISASQAVTNETRSVLSAGVPPTLTPTSVTKLQENQISVRVRSGTVAAAQRDALIPALDPNSAWIPLFAIEIPPAATVTAGRTTLDLRKWVQRAQPQEFVANGFDYPPHLYSQDFLVQGPRNWVTINGYRAPLVPPIGRGASLKMSINPQEDMSVGVSPVVYNWFYVYAFRPSENSGYASYFISNVQPNVSSAVGFSSAPVVLPYPFTTTASTVPVHYVGAVRFYQTGGLFYPRPFRQHSGYVTTTSANIISAPSGGGDRNVIISANITGISTQDILDITGGRPTIPPHVRTARFHFRFEITSGVSVSCRVLTEPDDWLVWESGTQGSGELVEVTLDVPLNAPTTPQQFQVEVSGGTATVWASTLGYYEESA